jgi:signal transduction histidine kinase
MEALVEMAHDMRSPLASIVLLVETMRQGQSGPVTPVQERQLGLVYGAAFGLSLLVSDLISLARSGDWLHDAEPRPFSVGVLFNSVRDIILPIAEEKSIRVLLSPPEGDWRIGYAAALQRVLLNLVTNALKFTDEGIVELGALELSRTGVEIFVRDSGKGIPAHRLTTLFDVFRPTEGDGESRVFSSSGLGLAICRKLVTAMGGEIRADNDPRGGARLSLLLDLEPASRIDRQAGPNHRR